MCTILYACACALARSVPKNCFHQTLSTHTHTMELVAHRMCVFIHGPTPVCVYLTACVTVALSYAHVGSVHTYNYYLRANCSNIIIIIIR